MPPELVSEVGNPRIQVLVIEGHGIVWKDKWSDEGAGDGTECAWVGKDNEVMEMVLMIVHM